MSQPPPQQQQLPPPPAGTASFPPGAPPPAGFPPAGFPSGPPPPGGFPPTGFPPPGSGPAPFTPNVPQATPPAMVNGIPTAKQPLNTTPSRTVYASNLNEKVKLDVLKNSLRTLFKQFGDVLDVVAHGNIRMRGQAFIAFPDEDSATKAIKELQHFVLYDKPMVLQYARNKSDVHAKADGDFDTHYQQRMARKEQVAKMPLPGSHKPTFKASRPQTAAPSQHNPTANIPDEYLPPNSILFLQKLPETITQQQLTDLFQRYPGFREVRMIPTKKTIAFVEYDNEIQSGMAKNELNGFKLGPDQEMKVTFARK
ncbi:uncharacterized protein B0P05DRAFT_513935 [Gilbertella persicaria]|uniref:RRM domain-containing protein n=1 Tax=Rhizopus stolonifer TaxID=4846 RepID=A0A367KPB3_RHIST|nr:uncharacterized protein B0P05DRAFT_513935 [Gilbertella persicaria]KAI8069762.1 hypothetical protein B0P05DRAFT_513935 [Gilbertella persicaria]RCI04054.1 hypothetical protein CU098_010143 [Rhizopus stolonifer]